MSYHETNVKQAIHTKFLGLNWKTHIHKVITKLSRACYVIGFVYFLNVISTFKTIYYAYFHSVIEYGIIFWGNSPSSMKVLQIQKKKIV